MNIGIFVQTLRNMDIWRDRNETVRAELRDAQSELALAYRQFDQATAPELVEACIYRISAAKARCDYYLRVLKAQEPEAAGSVRGGALWT